MTDMLEKYVWLSDHQRMLSAAGWREWRRLNNIFKEIVL